MKVTGKELTVKKDSKKVNNNNKIVTKNVHKGLSRSLTKQKIGNPS